MHDMINTLAEAFYAQHKQLYIVGGTVRDVLLHREDSNDEDLATDATPEEIKRIVAKRVEVPVEQVTPDTRLEDLGAGSLEVIEIVYDIEEKFGISVPIKPGESSLVLETETRGTKSTVELGTIGDIARAVQSLVDAKSRR